VLSAFPTHAISSNATVKGPKFVKKLGLNNLQGYMVRLENRERRGGREDIGSSNENLGKDPWSRAR
jgi:hypothetical protein